MHVRPAYWLLLLVCFLSTFCFACVWQEHVPAMQQVRVMQQGRAEDIMVVVHLTDSEGLPLEGAHVVVNTTMFTMSMPQPLVQTVRYVKDGCYKVLLTLTMPGRWVLTSSAEMSNFVTLPQRLLVNIPSFHLPTVPRLPSYANC